MEMANGMEIGNEDRNKTANCIEMEMIMKMADGMEIGDEDG